MRLQYEAADEAFRAELIAWLEANCPPREVLRQPKLSSADLPEWAREWQRTLFDAGWLIPGWPSELGGRDATPVQQMIYFEEMSRREIPRSLNPQALGIIAPSIRDYGTDEQRERFLVPTLRAELAWCLGMSEPGAGSDLASLSTKAKLDGDDFVVNGQKVWTSGAHHADWCLCFVRTDPDVPKHKGISALLIEMKTPGVETRPFPELTDMTLCDFNEVFLTDVRVPRANLVGPLHGGWPITQGSLAHERAMLWIDYAYTLQRAVGAMIELADRPAPGGGRLGDNDQYRDTVASFYVDSQALMAMGYRGFSKFMAGKSAPEHSLLKLYASEVLQECLLAASEMLGPELIDIDRRGPRMWREGSWVTQYLRSFGGTIPGGTSEIQRNIIAERVLGLPPMSERVLSEAEIAKMQTPLWEQAKAAIDAGQLDEAKALIDRAVAQWASLKDYSINWITTLLTFIADELGEDAVERALRKTGDEFVRPRRATGRDWGDLPAAQRAKVIARSMLGNMGEVEVDEDDEKIVLSFRCGSGGKLIDDGGYEGDHPYALLRESSGRTFMRDELWVYCAHCSVNNEIQPIEWGESPTSIEHPPTKPGERCVHHVYKDVADTPPDAFRRVGKEPPEAI